MVAVMTLLCHPFNETIGQQDWSHKPQAPHTLKLTGGLPVTLLCKNNTAW